jgi:hypothetical protein
MAKISTYDNASPVALTDKVIGTSVGGSPTDATKNFLLSDLLTLFQGSITLSNVLTAGNTATNDIVLTGDISCTNLAATGAVNGASSAITGLMNAGSINTPGAISGNSASISTTLTAATLTSTGVVNGATANITGRIDAQRVFVVQGVDAASVTTNSITAQAGNNLSISSLPSFPDNSTAKQPTGPLVAGDLYVTDGLGAAPLNVAGILMVVV